MSESTSSRRNFLRNSLAAGTVLGTGMFARVTAQTEPATTQAIMKTRVIPSSQESIPVIGLGTWQTFDPPDLSATSLDPLEAVLKTFYDAGGRVVDSSPMYAKAEQVTGLLSERLQLNDELFLATKVWTRGQDAGVRQMNESLQKLERKSLDLMQIHNLVDWETHLPTLREWKAAKTFRYIGVTHYQPSAFEALERIVKNERIDFVQLPYSVAVRDAEKRLLPAARDAGVAVLVNQPFEEGALFDRVKGKPLPDFARPFAKTLGTGVFEIYPRQRVHHLRPGSHRQGVSHGRQRGGGVWRGAGCRYDKKACRNVLRSS